MTVPVQVPISASTANGVTTVFPYGFKVIQEEDLEVTVDGVVVTTGFTVSGVGSDSGGNVTFTTAPANGAKVVRALVPVLERTTDYQQFGDWLADVVNPDFDRIWLALQYLAQNIGRALKLPVDTTTDQVVSEDAADRTGTVVSFDASGNMVLVLPADLSLQTVSSFIATLLDDANAAAARTTLGLGSAATLTAGTGANNVVQLDGSSKLPAVDGSQLTGIVAADEVTVSLLMLDVADLQNQAQVMGPTGNRFADSFDALTYVDTGAATNLDTGTAGKLIPTSTQTKIAGGTNIGDMTDGGGLAAAFDGTTSQVRTSSAYKGVSASGYGNTVGKDWGSGVTKNIARLKVWGPSNESILVGSASNFKLQGSNDGSAWTDLYTQATTTAVGESFDITSGITAGAYRYHRINISGNGANSCSLAEVEFYEVDVVNNLTVASTALTAASAPSTMSALVRADYVDTPTLNTDLMLDVSRDGGTTWTTATLSLAYTAPGSIKVLTTNSVSVSGQPSGTSPKWRIRTANNKMVHIRDVDLYWS